MERSAEWPGHSVSMKADTACRGWELTPQQLGSFSKGTGQQEAHHCLSGRGEPGTHQGSAGP